MLTGALDCQHLQGIVRKTPPHPCPLHRRSAPDGKPHHNAMEITSSNTRAVCPIEGCRYVATDHELSSLTHPRDR